MDDLFGQLVNITKANAYDTVSEQRDELSLKYNNLRNSLGEIVNEILNTNPKEVADSPSKLLQRISFICLSSLKEN